MTERKLGPVSQVLVLRGKLAFGRPVILRSDPARIDGVVADLAMRDRMRRDDWIERPSRPAYLHDRVKVSSIATHRYRVLLPEGETIVMGDMTEFRLAIRETEELQVGLEALYVGDDGAEITLYAAVLPS